MTAQSHLRRSSSGKDGACSSAQTAVRLRPRRSIVKDLSVKVVAPAVVAPVVVRHHYLHVMPAVATRCYGVYLDDALVGAVVCTPGARMAHRVLAGGRPGQVVTLARLWLADSLPHNSESRVLSVVCRHLAAEGHTKAVLTYADPAAGHTGTIYRAAGLIYLGQGPSSTYLSIEGRMVHPRSASARHGSASVGHLRRTGMDVTRVRREGKHRYIALLDESWRWRLRAAPVAFRDASTRFPAPTRDHRSPDPSGSA